MGNIKNIVYKAIANSPQLLTLFVGSYFSGNLWIYLFFTYFKKSSKGKSIIDTFMGRITLGLFWFIIFYLPIYFFKYGINDTNGDNLLSIIYITVLSGGFFQAAILFISTIRDKG